MVENIGNGLEKVGVSQEDLEESIAGLRELKPILQQQVMIGNGRDTKQGLKDAAELGKHFDTAIDAMTILLSGFPDYQKQDMKEECRTCQHYDRQENECNNPDSPGIWMTCRRPGAVGNTEKNRMDKDESCIEISGK